MADATFWEDLCPLEFGEIPALEEDVVCVGFPTGGDNISVTRGVVSRVEIQRYAHSAVELLAIQVRDTQISCLCRLSQVSQACRHCQSG